MLFAYRSIRVTTMVIFAVEGIAVVLLGIVGVAVMLHDGYHHRALSTSPFQLHGLALGALGICVVNAFGAFSGFEGAATLGEESRSPSKTIPRAIGWSLFGSTAIYIVFTWIANNAYATPGALAVDPAPFVHLANIYVSPVMGKFVNVAGVIGVFGAQLACMVAANRLIFALGRDVGSERPWGRPFLTRTYARFGPPVGALAVSGFVTLLTLLAFSTEPTAIRALIMIVEFGAYLIIVAYFLTVVTAAVWVARHARRVLPMIVLSVGVLVLGGVLYDTFHPFPLPPTAGSSHPPGPV